jgi:hypothetical protein
MIQALISDVRSYSAMGAFCASAAWWHGMHVFNQDNVANTSC